MQLHTKRLTLISLLLGLSLILSYVELLMPVMVAIPGFKIGLANIIIIFSLYNLKISDTWLISLTRVLIVAMIFTNFMSIIFSLAGAITSLLLMMALKRFDFGLIITSICGALMHNLAQVIIAVFLIDSAYMSAYMLPLSITAIISGTIIGIISSLFIKRFESIKNYI